MQHDVFISYSSKNKQIADTICAKLEECGYHCWIAPRDITPGASWPKAIIQAINAARIMVLVFSSEANRSKHVMREAEHAVRIDIPIVPFRIEDVEPVDGLGYFIRTQHWLNAMTPPCEQHIFQLADALKTLLEAEKPSSEEAKSKKLARIPASKIVFGSLFPQQNPYFTGREAVLADLRKRLMSGRKGAWKQAITGMGGVGKTQLAVEYAYHYRKKYAIMWWMRAEEPVTLASDYASLADVIGLASLGLSEDQMADQDSKIRAIQRWLDNESDWLLVFDNAKEPEDILAYLPHEEKGHVLITSRIQMWGGIAETDKPLVEFACEEAVDFVINRTGQLNKAAAEALAKELGCLPLALEQAGSYIKTRNKSIARYLSLFKERHEALLQRGRPIDYSDTVATTWEISFQQAERETKSAADLLALCAILAPDNIPRWLFMNISPSLAEEVLLLTDKVEFEDAAAALQNYSLIATKEDAISVHRLVQVIVRDRLSENSEQKWVDLTIRLLNNAFQFDEYDRTTWSSCAALVPHILQAKEHAERFDLISEDFVDLLDHAGSYFRVQANVSTARLFHQQSMAIGRALFGDEHPSVAGTMTNLGIDLAHLGDYSQAKEYQKEALKIRKTLYGDKHPDVARSLNNLGLDSEALRNYPQAKEYHEEALRIKEALYGDKHPDVARSLNNLGNVFAHLGDYTEAKKSFENAIAIYKAVYGDEHQSVAESLNNLGNVFAHLGDYTEAKKSFENAIAIYKAVYGDEHPYVATSLNNLGNVLGDLGDYDQAKECHEQALKIRRNVQGDEHPDVATSLNNLGAALRDLGDHDQAKQRFEEALKIRKATYGDEHPDVATSLNNLGNVLRDLGDYDHAKECFEQALMIRKATYGDEHPSVADSLTNLAIELEILSDYQQAKTYYERALKIYKAVFGDQHPRTINTLNNLKNIQSKTP